MEQGIIINLIENSKKSEFRMNLSIKNQNQNQAPFEKK